MKTVKRLYTQCAVKEAVIVVMVWCMLFNVPLALATPAVHSSTGASVSRTGNTTNVNMAGNRAIIKWNSLDTSAIETLKFNGSAGFAALNKIISGGATKFNGLLDGGLGNIFIINQKGIVFGPTAIIKAKTFVASGLDIKDADFLNNVYRFSGGEGAVINKGSIKADGVALIGKMVQNVGTITTGTGGYVAMVAGDKVYLSENGSNIAIEADGVASADIISTGADGAGDVTAGDVINNGSINSPSGQVILAAGDLFATALDLNTKAVKVDSGNGRVGQMGTINASAATGDGGNITLTAGDTVALGSESVTTANAGTNGNGGTITVYSPDTALFREGANVEVKGGSQSGNGGFFELSGKEYIQVSGQVDLTAVKGKSGTFLIDPWNLTIVSGSGSSSLEESGRIWEPIGTSSTLGIVTLEGYLNSGNVTLSTLGTVGDEDGDIIFDAGRYLTSNSNNSLFVKAADDIQFLAGNGINFTGNGGVELYAGPDGGISFVDSGMHNINVATVRGDIIMQAGSGGIDLGVLQTGHPNTSDVLPGEIRLTTTNGGDITAQHFGVNGQRYGSVYVNSAGNLTINGDEVNPNYAVHVKTVTTPGDAAAKSFICLTADKDVTIHGKVYAEAHGTPESVAGVWIGAGTNVEDPVNGYAGTVSIDDVVQADASAAGSTKEDATVRIYASTIELPTNKSKTPIATTGSVKYQGTTSGSESAGAVYDSEGNLISGSRALVEIDTTKDGTCLECENRVRVLLPIAVDDAWVNSKNLAVIINVVANDTDALGNLLINGTVDPASLSLTSSNGGTLAIDSNGKVVYVAPGDWASNFDSNGEYHDSFTYKVMDADGNVSENVATVTITLINQVPIANDNNYDSAHNVATAIDSATGAITGTLNGAIADYDPDNQIAGRIFDDTLTVQPITNQLTANGGHVTLNVDGSFTYTPSADNKTGTDSFTYTLEDGFGGSDTATVTIDLSNANPVANDNSYGTGHNVAITADSASGTITGTLNGAIADYDPDNQLADKVFDDTLTVQPLTDQLTANGGHVTLNADGSFTYTPSAENKSGSDSFSYTLEDGFGGSDTATVTIDLSNTNPVANDNSYGSGHSVALTVDTATGAITGTLNGAAADYDPDNQLVGKVFDDTLTVQPLTNQTTANGGTVTLNSDGSFNYTPSADNKTGTDSFTYTLEDGFGGTDTATITIDLSNSNPVANDNSYGSGHNVALTVDTATGAITGTLNGAIADYDPDNQISGRLFDDTLTVLPLTNQTTANGGTVTLNSDGSFNYTPSADNKTGTDSFTYTLEDGFGGTDTATVTIDLSNTNPVANDNSYGSGHNVALSVDTATGAITGTLNGAIADYDPDNQLADKVFDDTLTVQPITNQLTTNGGHITLNSDGSFTYTPSASNKSGTDSFTYTLKDGFGGTDTATVTISLSNQLPVAQPDSYTTNENVILKIQNPLDVITGVIPKNNGDYDKDNQIKGRLFNDVLNSFLSGGSNTGATKEGGTIKLNGDGTFTYTPPKDFSGTDSFIYYVTDGYGNSNQTTVTLVVIPGKTPPPPPPPPPTPPTVPTTNFVKREKVDIGGCPVLMQWLASETGGTADQVQFHIASTMDYASGTHPCSSCSRLKDAAAILSDENGERMAALAKVISGVVSTPGPITEEQMTIIASNFADHTADGTYYAQASEWIDALAAYVGILNKELRYSPEQSLALANKYYGPQLENENAELAAYVAARVAELGTNVE